MAFLPSSSVSPHLTKDDIYEVEKIVDSEIRNGKYLYKVRWKGCPREDDTWEPEENLLTCDGLLKTFKEDRDRRKRKKLKRKERERNESLQNTALPLHIKIEDDSDSDSSNLPSPSDEMDKIDLSGLTRKQKQAVQKVIEQSKMDAKLISPNSISSSGNDEDEEYKRVSDVSNKKKKIGKRAVIDDTSESEDDVIMTSSDKICTDNKVKEKRNIIHQSSFSNTLEKQENLSEEVVEIER